MAGSTKRFQFTTLNGAADSLAFQNWKFGDADRVALDRLMRHAVEGHRHTGLSAYVDALPPPILAVSPSGGGLPPNAGVHYRYSIVDGYGQETLASQSATAVTPRQVAAPTQAPTLTAIAGALPGGAYTYGLSVCTVDSTQETMLGPTATATVDVIGGWHLSLPALSSGGKFFNVYRKGPRDRDLAFLVSLDSAAVGFDDDGSIDADPLHRAPVNNTTNVTSSVSVALPATHVPAGTSWTWRIYRTYDPTEWDRSLLVWNGPTPSFVDDGRELLPGYPPEASGAVGGAPRIDIVAETTGSLPPDMVSATKLVNFTADRPQVGEGNWHWINEYRQAALVSLRAALGRGSPAQSGEVRIGIDRCDEGGSWVQLTNQSAQPIYCTIPQGQTMSSPVSLTTALPADALTPGDRLRLRVIQVAADETSARDLNVTVTMLVRDGTPGKTYVWKTT